MYGTSRINPVALGSLARESRFQVVIAFIPSRVRVFQSVTQLRWSCIHPCVYTPVGFDFSMDMEELSNKRAGRAQEVVVFSMDMEELSKKEGWKSTRSSID
jgi:hypothetical protein